MYLRDSEHSMRRCVNTYLLYDRKKCIIQFASQGYTTLQPCIMLNTIIKLLKATFLVKWMRRIQVTHRHIYLHATVACSPSRSQTVGPAVIN